MKLVIAVVALVASVNAFAAVNSGSSWSEIFSDKHAAVQTSYALNGQRLDNLCINGEGGLQTKSTVSVCLEYAAPAKCSLAKYPCDSVCVKSADQVLQITRDYTVQYCAQYVQPISAHYPDCAVPATSDVHIPDVVNADVYHTHGLGGESGSTYGFTKAYAFPSCQ